jgi:hypothetical protein
MSTGLPWNGIALSMRIYPDDPANRLLAQAAEAILFYSDGFRAANVLRGVAIEVEKRSGYDHQGRRSQDQARVE